MIRRYTSNDNRKFLLTSKNVYYIVSIRFVFISLNAILYIEYNSPIPTYTLDCNIFVLEMSIDKIVILYIY